MTHHVIYIPGLGDSRVAGQRLATRSWSIWGVKPHLFQMNWADGEAFEPKLQRLLKLVDELRAQGTVGLVAASAGAGAAINVLVERKTVITGVVCIAGKIHHPGAIGSYYRRKNPAFVESAHRCAALLSELSPAERQNILSIRAMFDAWVPARDSILEGAHNRVTWTSGHALTIGTQLVLGAPFFLRFLKQRR